MYPTDGGTGYGRAEAVVETTHQPEFPKPRRYCLTLLEDTETGSNFIFNMNNVEEASVKYATARCVALAQARGIHMYSIEVGEDL